MENNEALAQEAVRYLSLAQRFEQEGHIEKAIEHYGVAAEYLKNSGYLMQRIDEIYSRIEELKRFVKQEIFYRQEHSRAQVEQIQEQAFSLLDGAQKLESDGFLEDAIGQYMSAIKLLVQSGWTETQLENLKSKISVLAGNLERQKRIKTQKVIEPQQLETEPQVVGAFGKKKIASKAEELKRYREAKQREEQIETDAFAFIDNAKFFENDNKFDEAIENYENAIELLNLIGWQTQTQNIALIVQKLRKDKKEFEMIKTQKPLERRIIKGEVEIKGFDELELEEFKKDEEKIQINAFNLIDIGKKLEREKKYDKAIAKYEKAIELLKSIEWDSYIQPVVNFIKSIEEKQKYEEKTESLKLKRETDLKSLQDKIFLKEREEIVQTAKELEQKRLQFEQKRRKETRKETEFFTTLDNADKILKETSEVKLI
jgi:tetratricopeptide (TPR) repeat protein